MRCKNNTLLRANTPSLVVVSVNVSWCAITTMCEFECWKRCKEKNLKCENWSFEERQGQINFYLIWPRLYSNFISHFFWVVSLLCDWESARAHAFAHGHWLNISVCSRHETEFFCDTFHTSNEMIFFLRGEFENETNDADFLSTEVKHDELFDWIYLFRAKSIYADFSLSANFLNEMYKTPKWLKKHKALCFSRQKKS